MRTKMEMPFILEVIMGCSAAAAAAAAVMLLASLLNVGSYHSNGQQISGRQFLWPLGLFTLILPNAFLAVVAFALRNERSWSRDLLMAYGIGYALLLFMFNIVVNNATVALRAAGNIFVLCVPLAVYLYGKKSVQKYYRELEAREVSREPLVSSKDA